MPWSTSLGFGAPTDGDPVELGTRRMAWLATYVTGHEPGDRSGAQWFELSQRGFTRRGAPVARPAARTPTAGSAPRFRIPARDWQPSDLDALALRRYEALLTRRAWRDIVPLDPAAPLPDVQQRHCTRSACTCCDSRNGPCKGRADEVRRA